MKTKKVFVVSLPKRFDTIGKTAIAAFSSRKKADKFIAESAKRDLAHLRSVKNVSGCAWSEYDVFGSGWTDEEKLRSLSEDYSVDEVSFD